MPNDNKRLIVLKEATIVAYDVVAIAKLRQPETMQTPVIPFISVSLRHVMQPLILAYDSDEALEVEYQLIREGMNSI